MGCFLVINSYAGENQEVAAKKLALMFRMAPQQAQSVLDQVSKGEEWRFQRQIPDKQAVVAENYLKAIGFNVERTGQQAVVDQVMGSMAETEGSPAMAVATVPTEDQQSKALAPKGKGTTQAVAPRQTPSGKSLYFGFHGTGGGLFKILIVNWILNMLTLGIYYFWGKTNERRYLWEQTSFTGDRFFYHGTGKELFKGAMYFNLIFIGFALGMALIENVMGQRAADIASGFFVLGIWILIPAILVGAYRYRMSRTAWRGIRFSFRGTRKEAIILYVKGILLTLLTLGLYWPYFSVAKRKFWVSKTHFGNVEAEYEGEGKDIFGKFLLAVLLVPLTAGIYWFWYQAFIARYNWSKTQYAGGSFKFDATGGQMFSLMFVNMLLIVLTLGLGYSWVVARNMKFVTQHLTVDASMNLDKVVQDARQSGSLGEGAADGMDVDMDFGI